MAEDSSASSIAWPTSWCVKYINAAAVTVMMSMINEMSFDLRDVNISWSPLDASSRPAGQGHHVVAVAQPAADQELFQLRGREGERDRVSLRILTR